MRLSRMSTTMKSSKVKHEDSCPLNTIMIDILTPAGIKNGKYVLPLGLALDIVEDTNPLEGIAKRINQPTRVIEWVRASQQANEIRFKAKEIIGNCCPTVNMSTRPPLKATNQNGVKRKYTRRPIGSDDSDPDTENVKPRGLVRKSKYRNHPSACRKNLSFLDSHFSPTPQSGSSQSLRGHNASFKAEDHKAKAVVKVDPSTRDRVIPRYAGGRGAYDKKLPGCPYSRPPKQQEGQRRRPEKRDNDGSAFVQFKTKNYSSYLYPSRSPMPWCLSGKPDDTDSSGEFTSEHDSILRFLGENFVDCPIKHP